MRSQAAKSFCRKYSEQRKKSPKIFRKVAIAKATLRGSYFPFTFHLLRKLTKVHSEATETLFRSFAATFYDPKLIMVPQFMAWQHHPHFKWLNAVENSALLPALGILYATPISSQSNTTDTSPEVLSRGSLPSHISTVQSSTLVFLIDFSTNSFIYIPKYFDVSWNFFLALFKI